MILMNNLHQKSNYFKIKKNKYRIRMAQLTNKCTDDDIEYYVRECGDILGVS